MNQLTRHKNTLIYVTLFFMGFFVYFLYFVNPSLFLLKNYREFFTDIYFFNQYYNIPVLASFTITFILYSIYWLGHFSFGKAKYNLLAPFVPVIILIAMHNDYNHSLKFDIEILVTLLISCIYFRFFKDKGLYRFLYYPILLCFLYYFTGIKTVYLFSLLAIISELFSKGKRYSSLVILIETLIITLIFNHFFFISYKDVFKEFRAMQNIYALWLLPFLLYLSVLLTFIFFISSNLKRNIINQSKETANSKILFLNFKSLPLLLAIPVLTAGICYATFNNEQKTKLSVQYFGRNKDWNKVLELSKKSDFFDRAEIIYVNRALYF